MLEETELRVSLMKATRRLRAEKSDSELTDSQLSVLAVLDRSGPLHPLEISQCARVQPPSMTRILAALADRGLLDREPDPGDGRQTIVRITEAGSAAVTATRRQRDAWLARRLAELEPEERAVLAQASQILRRIADS